MRSVSSSKTRLNNVAGCRSLIFVFASRCRALHGHFENYELDFKQNTFVKILAAVEAINKDSTEKGFSPLSPLFMVRFKRLYISCKIAYANELQREQNTTELDTPHPFAKAGVRNSPQRR